MIDVFQDHFFSFSMFNLIFFDDVILVNRLHGKEFFGFFSFNEKYCTKSSSTKNDFRRKILKCDLFFETFFGEESLGCSSDHFSFFFFSLQILFIGLVIMHDIITFDFFWSLFFLFFFSSCIMDETKFIFVINGQFIVFQLPIGL